MRAATDQQHDGSLYTVKRCTGARRMLRPLTTPRLFSDCPFAVLCDVIYVHVRFAAAVFVQYNYTFSQSMQSIS